DVRARITVLVARCCYQQAASAADHGSLRGHFDAGDMRLADGDLGVAGGAPNRRPDHDFTRPEQRDETLFARATQVSGRGEPELHSVRQRVACGVFADGFELNLVSDRGGSLARSYFDSGHFGVWIFGRLHGLLRKERGGGARHEQRGENCAGSTAGKRMTFGHDNSLNRRAREMSRISYGCASESRCAAWE